MSNKTIIKQPCKKVWLLSLLISLTTAIHSQPMSINLNGQWERGINRQYDQMVSLPAITENAAEMTPGKLWYKRSITLPKGDWSQATLFLKGARFNPEVYVNGTFVSKQNGGMAPTCHPLNSKNIKPGATITIEIALTSLAKLDKTDASYVAEADHWRTNISSCIWDDIILELHGNARLARVIPFTDMSNDLLRVACQLEILSKKLKNPLIICGLYQDDKLLAEGKSSSDTVLIDFAGKIKSWSPEQPNLYRLRTQLFDGNRLIDIKEMNYAPKTFVVKDKQFYLNGNPYKLRAGSIVWHRWIRNKEGQELAWDTDWFEKNVILKLKEHGANTLRFHLGTPPERILDLCDRHGLLVQYEWLFFHGMPASEKSLEEQFPAWLDLGMEHPSTAIIHPYNETEGEEQMATMWNALNHVLPNYPPLVLEDRETLHIHKYWWSLFENLGVYYDSYKQFPLAIVVDEFGGNYLDGYGELGGYLTLKESYMRFLGKNHTKEERLKHQTLANAVVAEYWRRIGAAGFSPFVILSSWEDGNHWYLGELREGNPKPVWDALTAAYSPQSVSIELWDRTFVPNEDITLPIYLLNDLTEKTFNVNVQITDENGRIYLEKNITKTVPAYSTRVINVNLKLPETIGNYTIKAELLNRPERIKYPIVSAWNIRIFSPQVSETLHLTTVGVSPNETELNAFLKNNGIKTTHLFDKKASVMLLGRNDWEKIEQKDTILLHHIEQAINNGKSVVLLDVGMRCLGQGYPKSENNLGPLQSVVKLTNGAKQRFGLFNGIELVFTEVSEPESHIHLQTSCIGHNFSKEQGWLWNGLRGGLNVPAADMEMSGLNNKSFISQWVQRGAEEQLIKSDSYYAYELQGFFEFSVHKNDEKTMKKLRDRVVFLVEDAPALAVTVNPQAPIIQTDLTAGYKASLNGIAENQTALIVAGKNLTRMPVVAIDFGKERGNLIISQLLTKGRLAPGFGEEGLYGIRYDASAVQLILNILDYSINTTQHHTEFALNHQNPTSN